MSLKEYQEKRNFQKTNEPRGRVKPSKTGYLFVVQKHDASRLHYDFRLELDGVLKSWAIPKGPSLDPADKRLAVHVEDHPIDYGGFEGIIPEGYGAGTVMLWDRGSWRPRDEDPARAYREGHLKFDLEGEKLSGGWMLVRMSGEKSGDGKNWLLVKEKDESARRGKAGRITEHENLSVESGRSLEEIAGSADREWESHRESKRKRPARESKAPGREAARRPRAKASPPGTKGPDVATIAGARRASLPPDPRPQLATLTSRPPDDGRWLHEIKYDGYRILARIEGESVRLVSRNGKDWTRKFAAIADELRTLGVQNALLDGEVVVLDEKGVSNFQRLQNFTRQGKKAELIYYVFDLLHLNDHNVQQVSQIERKRLVAGLLNSKTGRIRYSDHIQGSGRQVLDEACRLGVEGIISKKEDAPYQQRRSQSWLKIKCSKSQEFVVGGYTDPGGSRKGFGALVLGYYDDEGRLVYCGRVGTGFNDVTLKSLHQELQKRERKQTPFDQGPAGADARGVHWITPELVAEVEFTEWTDEGILRHPSFKGLREDKKASEVKREEPEAIGVGADSVERRSTGRRPANRTKGEDRAEVAGVTLSNPSKVLYPEQGLTKQQLAEFYVDIAPWVLPYVTHRPLSVVRCPAGRQMHCFFQKHLNETVHPSVSGVEVDEKDERVMYLMIEGLEGLIALVQMGVLEIHPWGSRADRVDRPDVLVFDLDPDPSVEWEAVIRGARLMHERLEGVGLRSFLKTSGGKGLHVCVPIERRTTWEDAKAFSRAMAESITADDPAHYIATMSKARRKGRIFIDYLRNSRGATSVAAYSTRARAGAPVSVPVFWDELTPELSANQYTVMNLRERLNTLKSDPWADFSKVRQGITAAMLKKVGAK